MAPSTRTYHSCSLLLQPLAPPSCTTPARVRLPLLPDRERGPAGASAKRAQQGPGVECRWLDSLPAEVGRPEEPAQTLASVRGYLIAVSESSLIVHNVSSLYRSGRVARCVRPHACGAARASTAYLRWTAREGLQSLRRGQMRIRAAAPSRLLLASGNTLLVESAAVATPGVSVSGQDAHGSTLRLYASSPPYEPPTMPTWPKYVMGAAVIGITVVWQLYRRGRGDSRRQGRGRLCLSKEGGVAAAVAMAATTGEPVARTTTSANAAQCTIWHALSTWRPTCPPRGMVVGGSGWAAVWSRWRLHGPWV